MAEAAVKPTLRQERLAEAILDPNIKTKQAALLKAGYSPATARAAAGRQLELAGTKNALAARRALHGDRARGILHKGLDEIDKRIGTAQDQGVAAFTKVAADIVASGVVEQTSTSADQERAMRVLRRYGRYCYYLGVRASRAYESAPPVATREG